MKCVDCVHCIGINSDYATCRRFVVFDGFATVKISEIPTKSKKKCNSFEPYRIEKKEAPIVIERSIWSERDFNGKNAFGKKSHASWI